MEHYYLGSIQIIWVFEYNFKYLKIGFKGKMYVVSICIEHIKVSLNIYMFDHILVILILEFSVVLM